MRKINHFLQAFTKKDAWLTVALTIIALYIFGISALRIDVLYSLVSQLGIAGATSSVIALYIHPLDSFTYLNLSLFLLTGFLLGAQIVALRLYVAKRFFHPNQYVSIVGIISSLLGCLACCGSVLFVFILGIFGASTAALPFIGQEIAIAGVVLSAGALLYTIRKIDDPMVC